MQQVTWAIDIVALVVLIGVVAGLLVLVVKRPKAGFVVLGGVAVVVVVLVGMARLSYRHAAPVARVDPPSQVGAVPVDWEADVYPSVRAAVLSRVPLMAQVIRNLTGGAYPPAHVHVRGDVDVDLLREFTERLREQEGFAESTTTWRGGEETATGEMITINVNMLVERERAQHWSHSGVAQESNLWREGRVMVTAARGGRTASPAHARFIEKPWVEDWSGFVAGASSGQNWLRAESHMPVPSPQEAQQLAIKHAEDMLTPLVHVSLSGRWNSQELRRQLEQGQLVTDRFIQRVERPYGELYTAMLLIDASPPAIQSLAHDVTQVQMVRRQHVLGTAGSLAALMGVIGLVYLFLNAVTKGYYRPQLVVVMVAAAVVVVVVMVA